MSVTTAPPPEPEPVAPDTTRSFDDDAERFFLAEGSLAPTELVVAAIDQPDEDPAPLSHAERLASPRRRALARWVGGVVAAFAVFCVAAFATKGVPATAHAAAPRAAPPAPLPSPVIAHVEQPVPVAPPAAPAPAPAPETNTKPEPARAVAVREAARAALSRGALDESVERGFESVELDPSDAEAWLILGAAQMAKGQNTEARSTFTACTKIASRGPRGECFQMLQ